jgi:hypothetical protein
VGIVVYALSILLTLIGGYVLETIGVKSTRILASKVDKYRADTPVSLLMAGSGVEEAFYGGYLIEGIVSLTGAKWLGRGGGVYGAHQFLNTTGSVHSTRKYTIGGKAR